MAQTNTRTDPSLVNVPVPQFQIEGNLVAEMIDRLSARRGKLAFFCEAWPCGYGLLRQIALLEAGSGNHQSDEAVTCRWNSSPRF